MLGLARGSRKAILYVGQGIDYSMGADSIDLMEEINAFLASASRANVVMHTVDPAGLTAPDLGLDLKGGDAGDFARSLDDAGARAYTSLRVWAGETGGTAVVNTNNIEKGLASIVQQPGAYYLLGYQSAAPSDGKFHKIEIRAARPGLTVRSRPGFMAAPVPGRRARGATTAEASGPGKALDDALASPAPATAVRLRVSAAPFKGVGSKQAVLVGVHVDGRDLGLVAGPSPNPLSALVEIVVLDSAGKVAAATRNTVDLSVPAASVPAVQQRGLRYVDRVAVPSGHYRVRAGVAFEADRLGTVECEVEVPDFARPGPSLSGVLVSSSRAAPVHVTGSYYKEWLPNPPTAERRFHPADELTAFAELYGFASPDRPTIAWTVFDAAGKVELEAAAPAAAESGPGTGVRPVPMRSTIPLRDLAPGRHRLKLDVRDARGASLSAAREVVFVVATDDESR